MPFGGISGIELKSSLMGFIKRRNNSMKGNGLEGLLTQLQSADLMERVAKTPMRRGREPIRANLAIADRFDSSASLQEIGRNNALNGVSRTNVADSALSNAGDIMIRMTELTAMATNPTLRDSDRASLNAEVQALNSQLGDMRSSTTYAGKPVLQGDSVGTFTGEGKISTTDADLSSVTAVTSGIDISTAAGANAAFSQIEKASVALSKERATVGSNANTLNRNADFSMTRAAGFRNSAASIRESELGIIGSLFGEQLAPIVNELLGLG